MKKLLFLTIALTLSILPSISSAMTVYCTNCADEVTATIEHASQLQQLSEAVTQSQQQIQMVQQNLERYQNMLQNTKNLSPEVISQMAGQFRTLATSVQALNTQRGEIQALQDQFQKTYPGYSSMQGQTGDQYQQRWVSWSQASDQATQATFQASGKQLQDLQQNSAAIDDRINQLLSTPQGRMEALQAGNQLSAMQLQEARELRSLLATQTQMLSQAQAKANQDAEAERAWSVQHNDTSSLAGASKRATTIAP